MSLQNKIGEGKTTKTAEEILNIIITELNRDVEHYHTMSEQEKCLGMEQLSNYHEGKVDYANDILEMISELKGETK